MTEGIGFKFLFCVLVFGSLLIGGCCCVFRQGNLRNVKVAYGSRTVDTAVGAGHTFDIAAVELACGSSLNRITAFVQSGAVLRIMYLTAHSCNRILHGSAYAGRQREAQAKLGGITFISGITAHFRKFDILALQHAHDLFKGQHIVDGFAVLACFHLFAMQGPMNTVTA